MKRFSVHGGHSSIDNHNPWWSGFDPALVRNSFFLPALCPRCPGLQWCYNLERPPDLTAQVKSLRAIYDCYRQVARDRGLEPFCVTVHAPFPPAFERMLELRYEMPYIQAKVQMPREDFPVFLRASRDSLYRAVEFEILPAAYRTESDSLIREVRDENPSLIRIASLHHLEIDGQILRQGNQHGERERTLAVYQQVGPEYFWRRVLETTLEAVGVMDCHALGHPFGWHKRLPEPCPVNAETRRLAAEIAQIVARRQIYIDLNTSGFCKGNFRGNPYFPAEWVPIFLEAGARFTCGDDSHNQSQVGQGYNQLSGFLQSTGIKELWRPVIEAIDQLPRWTPILVS